uniref:Uncharacterized protein n=1 Tax=Rangifer tarandus platyrhynchus TaxID=3082113 RepID=A0ACB0F2H5_RANTA|nr:unnamed protein product [Rangifer tarandus platyrhynchus]
MKTLKGFCVLFMLQLCLLDSGRTGKVLVWPVDFSHWINLQVILEELHLRGHEITVLVPSQSLLIDHTKLPYNVEILQLSVTKETFMEELNTLLYEATFELSKLSWWERQIKLANIGRKFLLTIKRVCDSAVTNKELLSRLQAAKFDVCIADPLSFCGELVAELLNIPFMYTFRFFYGNVIERLCAGLPMPSSYVPGVTSRFTDNMTFIQRLENWLLYTVNDVIYSYYVFPEWDEYYSKVLGKPTTVCEIMGKADMWLFRSYWDFEFPQPYLPNTEFVGGLHCKPAKPLPKDFEEFVQSSGKDGVVVFTLGSMIKNLSEEKSNIIASALAQIPQKVLWRYTGKKPETLGANTRLYKWIPQNDLLGHPKTRAFITHCGTNGIYEAIYHGVPMVGIPMFGDQHDNVARMKAKGAAVEVDLQRMTSADLLNALKAVINNPFYKENAMKLSRFHHDQPVKSLDRAVFWVEFIMRHKGAKHLRPAFHDLTWYQHRSLDVIGFLLACHPKTKAFITHGRTNGIYEAIYHGIPMVGLPLFAEQHDNIERVKAKGAAVRLDLETMSSRDLLNALKEVINNPFYKETSVWLSTIHHDQPVKPLDRAVFWIEFVMRHKGAKHLRPAAHDLTWLQYHSLDVIGFLLACVATVVFVTTKCFLFCYSKFAKIGKKQKRE